MAVLWTTALIPLAFLAPAYQGESASSTGATTRTTATLVGVNGAWVAVLLCIPLCLAVIASFALRRRTRAVWLPVAVLAAFALVSAASIGLYYLPPAALLIAAAATAR